MYHTCQSPLLISNYLPLSLSLSLLKGYSISSHCIILLISTLFDHNGLPGMFYLLWLLAGGLTAAKMVLYILNIQCMYMYMRVTMM